MPVEERRAGGRDAGAQAPQPGSGGAFGWFKRLSVTGRCLVLVGVLLVAICALFGEENWRGRRAWAVCRRDLEAKGALDWQKFVPPAIPDDQNFAATPFLAPLFDFNPRPRDAGQSTWRDMEGHDRAVNFAAALLPMDKKGELPAARFDGRRTDLEGALSLLQSNQAAASFSSRAEAAAAVLAALKQYEPVLAELRAAGRWPHSRFDIEYDAEDPISILLPHYLVLTRVTRVLEVRASAELALGKSDAAFEDAGLMHRLADSIQGEPFIMGGVARGSMMKRTEQIIWEGLAGRNWSEAQLREFQKWLENFKPLKDLDWGLQAEQTAFGDKAFRYVRRHKNTLRMWLGSDEARPLMYLLSGPEGWFYQEQVTYHRLYDERVLAGFDADTGHVQPSVIEKNREALERELKGSVFWHHTAFSRLIFGNVMKTFQSAAFRQDRANQAVAACALERYRLANGKYPEAMDALTPRFVDKPPLDVCNGQSLKYRLIQDNEFLLYGVGWNEKDDGGTVIMKADGSERDPSQGDWVWPPYSRE